MHPTKLIVIVLLGYLLAHLICIKSNVFCRKTVSTNQESSAFDTKIGTNFEQKRVLIKSDFKPDKSDITLRSITVNIVPQEDFGLMPSFKESGFEFRNVRDLKVFQNEPILMEQYHKAVQGAEAFVDKISAIKAIEPIVHELNELHFEGKTLKIIATNIKKIGRPDMEYKETNIHFDYLPTTNLIMWIPLHKIDNFQLGMGDIRALRGNEKCTLLFKEFQIDGAKRFAKNSQWNMAIDACKDTLFRETRWYQANEMDSGTIILLKGNQKPHFSADLGEDRNTSKRYAFIITLDITDITPNSM